MILSRDTQLDIRLLTKLIEKHERLCPRYDDLHDYYTGKHAILERKRESSSAANNKIVCNHAKYITDMTQAFMGGNEIAYAVSDGFDIEAVKNAYSEQSISVIDSELIRNVSIFGRAYELIYTNEDGKVRSVVLDPRTAFVIYDDTCIHKPMFGIYYYKVYDADDNVAGIRCTVYDEKKVMHYAADVDNWLALHLTEEENHFFGQVPLVEYINNADAQGDFEQVIPLIDAYNILQSDRVNDKEQFVESFLFLSGIEIDSEQAKKLKEEKILMGYEGAKAEYLSKVLSETDVKVLRDDLKEDIHRFSMVPPLTDENFGNNLSGVAIKYKLLGFEQMVKNKEQYMSRCLRLRFEMYNYFLTLRGEMTEVPSHRIEIIYSHNLPANNLETAQMISYLEPIVPHETLMGQLSFISDPSEEAELKKKEDEEKHLRETERTEELAAGGGFGKWRAAEDAKEAVTAAEAKGRG